MAGTGCARLSALRGEVEAGQHVFVLQLREVGPELRTLSLTGQVLGHFRDSDTRPFHSGLAEADVRIDADAAGAAQDGEGGGAATDGQGPPGRTAARAGPPNRETGSPCKFVADRLTCEACRSSRE